MSPPFVRRKAAVVIHVRRITKKQRSILSENEEEGHYESGPFETDENTNTRGGAIIAPPLLGKSFTYGR